MPEAAEGRQRVVEAAARDAQHEVRAAAVAHGDVGALHVAAGGLRRPDDPVGGALDLVAPDAQRQRRVALDRARAGGGRRRARVAARAARRRGRARRRRRRRPSRSRRPARRAPSRPRRRPGSSAPRPATRASRAGSRPPRGDPGGRGTRRRDARRWRARRRRRAPRAGRARPPGRGRGCRHDGTWQASRRRVRARCRRVDALVGEMPSTLGDLVVVEAAVEAQGDELAVAGVELGQRGADGDAARGLVGVVGRADRVRQRGDPLSPPQLVERGVAHDPEQPGAVAPAPGVEGVRAAQRPLEGDRRDLLGRRPVAQQRRRVGEHVVHAGAVQRLEGRVGHVGPTEQDPEVSQGAAADRVRSAPKPPAARGYVADVRAMRSVAAAIVGTLALAGPVAARASVSTEKPWATVNVCDTKDHPDAFGVRGYMRGLGGKRRTHMYLRIQGGVPDRQRHLAHARRGGRLGLAGRGQVAGAPAPDGPHVHDHAAGEGSARVRAARAP